MFNFIHDHDPFSHRSTLPCLQTTPSLPARGVQRVGACVRSHDLSPAFKSTESVIEDLVSRAILSVEPAASTVYSFGHLTFQEHLAALWLAENSDPQLIVPLIDDFFWSNVLNMFASRKPNLAPTIERHIEIASPAALGKMKEMVALSPLTPRSVIQRLEDQIRQVPRRY